MRRNHPHYTEPLPEDMMREHVLHRIVAGSAFALALCILPVAQYFLVGSQEPKETGQVAGVAIEAPANTVTTLADVQEEDSIGATLVECTTKKEQDSSDLSRFLEGKKKAMLREYNAKVDPYRKAIAQITDVTNNAPSERDALNKLIDDEYQSYLKELGTVETAVATEQQAIDARVCPAA